MRLLLAAGLPDRRLKLTAALSFAGGLQMSRLSSPQGSYHPIRHTAQRFQRLLDAFRPECGVESNAVPEPVTRCEEGAGRYADFLLHGFFVEP
jgi:hypothetical protein